MANQLTISTHAPHRAHASHHCSARHPCGVESLGAESKRPGGKASRTAGGDGRVGERLVVAPSTLIHRVSVECSVTVPHRAVMMGQAQGRFVSRRSLIAVRPTRPGRLRAQRAWEATATLNLTFK